MKIKERVLEVTELQSGTSQKGNEWSSRDLVLITDERYPRKIAFTFKGQHCQQLDNIHPNDIVEVTFDAESRLVNGRYYHALRMAGNRCTSSYAHGSRNSFTIVFRRHLLMLSETIHFFCGSEITPPGRFRCAKLNAVQRLTLPISPFLSLLI